MSASPNPTLIGQTLANFKRRLLQFVKGSKEMIYVSVIFLFPLLEVIFLSTIIRGIQRALGVGDNKVLDVIIQNGFPGLVIAGIVFSCGVFVLTPVKDKEDKLRYLLNFAGIRSISYYLGIFLADILLYCLPISVLILMSYILSIK